MELFYSAGPEIVREIKRRGHKIFLDLKLHDIPNTVGRSMAVLSGLDVDICNLHAAGGSEMMRAAVKGLTREDGSRPLLIAVTMLTSIDEERMNGELGIQGSLPDTVMKYALCARDSGLDGVVRSPLEAQAVHETCGESFLTVTPGIRFSGGAGGRSEARHYSRTRPRDRLGLHSRRQTDNRSSRPIKERGFFRKKRSALRMPTALPPHGGEVRRREDGADHAHGSLAYWRCRSLHCGFDEAHALGALDVVQHAADLAMADDLALDVAVAGFFPQPSWRAAMFSSS